VGVWDADWHTLMIAGGVIAVAQAVTRQHGFVASRQGDIGRRLVQSLIDAGCDDVDLAVEVLSFRDLPTANFMLSIRSTLDSAMEDGAIARDARRGVVGRGARSRRARRVPRRHRRRDLRGNR
jgi:hypothetical protein